MGAKPSSISDLQHNPVLLKLTGETAVAENDEFWEDILAFSFQAPYNSADARLLEEATEPICQRLVGNNLKTGNFVTLIKMFLKRIPELKDSAKCEEEDFTWETYNAILLVRSFSKYFIEFLPNEEVIRQLGGSVVKSQGDEVSGFTEQVLHCTDCGVIEDLICGLVDVIINVPISEVTYPIHVEAINTLLVMLSVQMFDPNASESSIFFQVIMKGKCHSNADDLVKVLLKNFIIKEKTPQQLVRVTNEGGSLVFGLGLVLKVLMKMIHPYWQTKAFFYFLYWLIIVHRARRSRTPTDMHCLPSKIGKSKKVQHQKTVKKIRKVLHLLP